MALLRPGATLDEADKVLLQYLRQERDVEVAYNLAQRFLTMVHNRKPEALDLWLSDCLSSGVSELETFATGLLPEYAAIQAALELPYSNGPVEGQVTRLKQIQRVMYGRGNFDLLRQRLLTAA